MRGQKRVQLYNQLIGDRLFMTIPHRGWYIGALPMPYPLRSNGICSAPCLYQDSFRWREAEQAESLCMSALRWSPIFRNGSELFEIVAPICSNIGGPFRHGVFYELWPLFIVRSSPLCVGTWVNSGACRPVAWLSCAPCGTKHPRQGLGDIQWSILTNKHRALMYQLLIWRWVMPPTTPQ